jgi:hypothetical protein
MKVHDIASFEADSRRKTGRAVEDGVGDLGSVSMFT